MRAVEVLGTITLCLSVAACANKDVSSSSPNGSGGSFGAGTGGGSADTTDAGESSAAGGGSGSGEGSPTSGKGGAGDVGGSTSDGGAPGSGGTSGTGGSGAAGSGGPPSSLWTAVSASPPPAWSGPKVAGTVTVDRGTVAGHLAPGFVGLSYEKSHLTDQFFTANNAPLIALCNLLGPSVVRIGGNSVDKTSWQPTAPAAAVDKLSSAIGTADVDGLAAFLQATNWRVIYGVNLKTSTPQVVAAESKYAAGKLGGHLDSIEIGNEPDLYGQTYATWSANWAASATAIRSAVPDAPLAGPATAGGGVYEAVDLAHDEASRLALVTQHYYRGSGKTTSPTDVVMAQLVSPDSGLTSTLKQLSAAVTSNHIPSGFRLAEANSFFAHGAPGVSNAFGSALWAIDFLFQNAENGSSGVNFHGGGAGQDGSGAFIYTPINEANGVVTGAQPIFYGMLLVTSAGNGDVLATTAKASSVNFTAYAVAQADGSTNLVLNNKDTANAVDATVDVGTSIGTASVVFLQAASLLATSDVTFAGDAISTGGSWTPKPAWTLPVSGHTVSIVLPPASAALLHVQ